MIALPQRLGPMIHAIAGERTSVLDARRVMLAPAVDR
jgi:hypothetical protein